MECRGPHYRLAVRTPNSWTVEVRPTAYSWEELLQEVRRFKELQRRGRVRAHSFITVERRAHADAPWKEVRRYGGS